MTVPPESLADLEQALEAVTDLHVAGQLAEARSGYLRILEQRPGHGTALHRLAVLEQQVGRPEAALQLLGRALALDATAWRAHFAMGQSLLALGRGVEAKAAFLRTAELNPDCLEAFLAAGGACRALGQPQEAIALFSRAADLAPERAEAHNNLGVTLQDAGRLAEAIAAFRRALALNDGDPVAHANLGNALLLDRRPEASLELLEAAVARWPEHADAWYNLGNAAFALNRFSEAEAAFRRTLALVPGHVAAANNLGNVLQAFGRNQEALDTYLAALQVDPGFRDSYNNASAAARAVGQMDLAASLLRQALVLDPDFPVTHGNLGNVLKDVGLMAEAIQCFRRALELQPRDPVIHSNLAYAVCFLPGFSAEQILAENLAWDRVQARGLVAASGHGNTPDPERRLRIGYVSPDFREHCQSLFTIPLLSQHDHERFEIFCYAKVPLPDTTTWQVAELADVWRDTAALSDAEVADLVRADGIDILVDLTMHMANGRPLLFARKPAPVQVAWLAYPGTTGLAAIDYRLTDPYLDPPGEHDPWYSEQSIRLPDTFWCYDPLTAEPVPGPLPALTAGRITFGSLNNFCKVTPAVLRLWARVMSAVPGSRLLLLSQPGSHRQRVLDGMAEGGVGADRIEFAAFRPRLDYLALYQRIDLGLDTFPYNGHTTSLDAFWMGVPVVTRIADTVVGRAGWSQLCNLDLRELAADSDEDFVRIATGLAGDLSRLAGLRAGLRQRMEASPLMDGARFARGMEAALRGIWQEWCAR